MRILAIDTGEKRIGLAVSDPAGSVATPCGIINHVSFQLDLQEIYAVINQKEVELVIIGLALDDEGHETKSSRRAKKIGEGLINNHDICVEYFDESYTTNEAKQAAILAGVGKKKRSGHLDDIAATLLLQRYLEVIEK